MILISGCTGVIGQNLINILEKKKKKFKIITRNKKETLKNYSIIYTKNIFKHDFNWWKKNLENVEVFIHLAWYNNHKDYINSKKNIESKNGTIKIANYCKKLKIKHFIGIGTCLEYKEKNKKISVTSSLGAKNLYGQSKIQTYKKIKKKLNRSPTVFSWCRLFYVYDENDKATKLYNYLSLNFKENKKIYLSNPFNIYDFISAKKVSQQIYKIIKKKKSNVYNICNSKGVTVLNFAKKLKYKLRSKSKIEYNNKKNKIQKIVGISNLKF